MGKIILFLLLIPVVVFAGIEIRHDPTAGDDITLGTPNGLSLTNQILSLDLATASTPGALSASDKDKIDETPLENPVEFLNTDVRFFGELGVPSSTGNGWIDIPTGIATIDIVNQDVFGTLQDVVRHNDDTSGGSTTSEIVLTAQNWTDINAFGASYSGVSRLDTTDGANGFFSGLQDDVPDKRYGITFKNSGGKLRLDAGDTADPFDVIMDGTSGNPNVNFDEWFRWEVVVPPGLGLADVYVNSILLSEQLTFITNSGGGGTVVRIGSGSTGGIDRITYHANFGATIYEDSSTKTLLDADFAGFHTVVLSIPPGKRDYTIQLDAGIVGREIGGMIEITAQNINGNISIVDLSGTGNILINGLNSFTRNILEVTTLVAINTVDGKNSYFIPFDFIREDTSGNIILTPTASLVINDASIGTAGECLVSTDTAGTANWETCPGAGGAIVSSATIDGVGTPSITRQNPTWITSITDNGVGNYTLQIVGSFWSLVPSCTCSGSIFGNICNISSSGTTAVSVRYTTSSSSNTDGTFHIRCPETN